jgi:hypothetical protein
MIKTLLIPTDFKIESLNTLKLALQNEQQECQIILIGGYFLKDSITELLFYDADRTIKELVSSEFDEALSIIKNRFENIITKFTIKLTHIYSAAAMKEWINSEGVTHICIPKSYKLKNPKRGFDPSPLLKKTGLPVREVDWIRDTFSADDQIYALFN